MAEAQATLAELDRLCRQAHLTDRERQCVLLALVERLPVRQIRLRLELKGADADRALHKGFRKLAGYYPEVRDAARQFRKHLILGVENRQDHDERPEWLRGVTPANTRFQGFRQVGWDHPALRQDDSSATRLWANEIAAAGAT